MSRRLMVLAVWLGLPAGAAAQSSATAEVSASAEHAYPGGKQELGAQLGLAAGGRVTPGGAYVAGRYLYRLSHRDWAELGVGFTYGSPSPGCFRDRDDQLLCDHGTVAGFGGQVDAGLRRYFLGRDPFSPYLRAGVTARVVSFGDDHVRGFALPLWLGGGVRAEVSPGVFVGGDAVLSGGVGWFNRGLGGEPQLTIAVMGSVEFSIGD